MRHTRYRPLNHVLKTHNIQTFLNVFGQVWYGMQGDHRRTNGLVFCEQHVGTTGTVKIGKMVNKIQQDSALMLRLNGAINLSQLTQANNQFSLGLDMQQ